MANIDQIDEIEFEPHLFEDLILGEGIKEDLMTLVSEQQNESFREKSQGLLIMLHGPSGVGKTATVRGIAEVTRAPLMPITTGGVGNIAQDMEGNLARIFRYAQRWRAILLLDDAEVFLEQRAHDQFDRGLVVSVFLRGLEQYNGMLIITTNRVGTLDDAFLSRIDISFYYEPLTPKRAESSGKI
jgi:SpoVK/Ycf46/Vps4 family AAA+-type ATPase